MTPEQISLVQDSYSKIEPMADTAAELFYGKLFNIAPEVKPMFNSSITMQGKKLMTMIGIAVNGLTELEKIIPAVQQLGKRHVAYGVKDEHFPIVGEALLWTLEQGLGDEWNDELKEAWATTYALLASTMIAAMKEEALTRQESPKKTGVISKVRKFFGIAEPA